MARRRQISTGISVDKNINKLAVEHGDFAAMLYTWMIPHAEEDATLTGDPEEILFSVIPGRRDKTVDDVVEALSAMSDLGLIEWDRLNNLVGFPIDSFYKYQSNVKADRRRTCSIFDFGSETGQRETPPNATEHHTTPEITASSSVSVSSSVAVADARETAQAPPTPEIEIEHTPAERRIASRIKQVRGMATVPDNDIITHIREILSDRASPLPEDVLLAEAMRFRDYWQEKRSNQPEHQRWKGWKRAATNWFTRTKHDDNAPSVNGLDRYEDWTGRYAESQT